jgi:RND family efflux transporter MFP subunit
MFKKLVVVSLVEGLFLLQMACSNTGQAGTDTGSPIPVRTTVIQPESVTDYFQAPGTVRAKTNTLLSSKVVGQVLSVAVREGDRVHTGQLLVEIDARDASAGVRRAEAGLKAAEQAQQEADRGVLAAEAAARATEANRDLALATRKRYDLLRDRHSVSAQEYDEVDTRYKAAVLETQRAQESLAGARARRLQMDARIEQAQAEVDASKLTLGYSRILSPIDGLVTVRHVEPGVMATPGMALLSIEDDCTYELDATVEESHIAVITVGQMVPIEIDVLPDARINGRVREIAPASDPATRTYSVKLQLPQAVQGAHRLRSGLFGRALFTAGERPALIVPQSALVTRGQLTGVYLVTNGVVVFRFVTTGKRYDEGIEILSGLSAGSRYVIVPPAGIFDGLQVTDERPMGKTP